VALLIAALLPPPPGAAQAPAPTTEAMGYNALEDAYVWIAAELASADAAHHHYPVPSTLPAAISLCEKIHPEARELSVSFFGLEAWSYSYLASQCFTHVAETVKVIELCDRVRAVDTSPSMPLLAADRERPVTPEACRTSVRARGSGGVSGSYDHELIALLLGYSREQITAGAGGRLPEEGGAFDFLLNALPRPDDDHVDFHKVWNDHLARLARLPDFSRGDEAARTQLNALAPGWSSPTNTSRLAETLRCAVERHLRPGETSPACRDRF
jgi:hypothetical protein